jgi:hypothetical protein
MIDVNTMQTLKNKYSSINWSPEEMHKNFQYVCQKMAEYVESLASHTHITENEEDNNKSRHLEMSGELKWSSLGYINLVGCHLICLFISCN